MASESQNLYGTTSSWSTHIPLSYPVPDFFRHDLILLALVARECVSHADREVDYRGPMLTSSCSHRSPSLATLELVS
jgi:hypothetical protein